MSLTTGIVALVLRKRKQQKKYMPVHGKTDVKCEKLTS
jgi:hypothetical protein